MKGFINIALSIVFAAAALVMLSGCEADKTLPAITFQQLQIQGVQPDASKRDIQADMSLKFLFNNTGGADIHVKPHDLKLLLDGNQIDGLVAHSDGYDLVPNRQTPAVYTFHLDLNESGQLAEKHLLGRKVKFTVAGELQLDIPFAGVKAAAFKYEDSIVLPMLPRVEPDLNRQPTIALVGKVQSSDYGIAAMRDAMKPFADAMTDLDQEVGGTNVLEKTVGKDVFKQWKDFRAQWDKFKSSSLSFPDLRNSRLEGVRIEVPVKIINPNDVPIKAPGFELKGAVKDHPAIVNVWSNAETEELAPHEARPVVILVEVRWSELPQGLSGLIQGSGQGTPDVKFTGSMTVDVGIGQLRLPVDLSVPMRIAAPIATP
jgi:hypothetical protein